MADEEKSWTSPTLRALAPGAVWTSCAPASGRAGELAASVPAEALARMCAGHFPGAPIVPGAHLLGCLLDLARRVDPAASVVERCVFRAQVAPDAGVVLAVWPEGQDRVAGEIRVPGSGRPAVSASFTRGT